MKKLLASALLAGLLLGTTAPVFAEEVGTKPITQVEKEGTTDLKSNIEANYLVNIPSELSIDLMNGEKTSTTGSVTLVSLTAAGSILVKPTVSNLELTTGSHANVPNETVITTLTNGAEISEELTDFQLVPEQVQNIRVETTETSKENIAGSYEGSIKFVFEYVAEK